MIAVQVIIKGRHIEVTEALKAHAEEKVRKVARHYDHIVKADVELIYEQGLPENNQICEITAFGERTIFRARAATDNLYTSIDQAADRIEKQMQRHKGRSYLSENKHHSKPTVAEAPAPTLPRIAKRKVFEVWRMNPDEAAAQMEFLGHDFFVFVNDETENVSVLYRRRDGNLGLIEAVPREG